MNLTFKYVYRYTTNVLLCNVLNAMLVTHNVVYFFKF